MFGILRGTALADRPTEIFRPGIIRHGEGQVVFFLADLAGELPRASLRKWLSKVKELNSVLETGGFKIVVIGSWCDIDLLIV